MKKCYIVLENGRVFEGLRFGAEAPALGEMVFTTGVVGYLETLTDPSYYGQIVMQTFPSIGNYGVIEEDFEGSTQAAGYVVRSFCDTPSNFRSQYDIDTFLKRRGIPGVYGVDTREITRLLRMEGVMNACICDEVPGDLTFLKSYRIEGAVPKVSCASGEAFPPEGEKKYKVALIDYGAKHNIIRELNKRGCEVWELPYDTQAQDILNGGYDGVMLSNGPGDPRDNEKAIGEIRHLLGRLPIFGICLGHQLLALAAGGEIVKLKFGHRGANQPVRFVNLGRTYITSQNHGYAADMEHLPKDGKVIFENANDHTCEGLSYPSLRAFSAQFHPEACAGPQDTSFLFDQFVNMMGGKEVCL